MKSRRGEFLYLSTDFEPPNKQGTQPLTEFLLSFVESLGGGEGGIRTHNRQTTLTSIYNFRGGTVQLER